MLGFSRASWARFARESLWVFAGQVATALAGLVGVRVLTELVPREVFGEASLWLGVLILCRNFFLIPISMFQLRYQANYAVLGQVGTFTGRINRLAARSTTAFVLAGGLCYLGWAWATSTPVRPALLIALASCACMDAAKTIRQNVLSADRRQLAASVWTGTEAWTVVGLTAAALLVVPNTEAYLFGTAAGHFLPLLVYILFVPSTTDAHPGTAGPADRDIFYRQVARYGLPFVPLAVVVWFTNLGDRYLLNWLRGTADVGLYVAAFGLASKPALMIGGVIAAVARPILFNAVSAGRTGVANRVFHLWLSGTALLNAGLAAVLYVFGPWIARWFLAAEYREGAPEVMAWIAAGFGVYATIQVVENRIMSFGHSASLIAPVVVGAILKLILTYFFVQSQGLIGTARATFAAFVGQFLATWWAMTRLTAAEARGATQDLSTTENGNGPSERSGSPPPASDVARHTGDRPDGE
jgi:O-antigen/teichoic acid export membrane protein